MYPDDFLRRKLQDRIDSDSLRTLRLSAGIDFCSNDYLGIVKEDRLGELTGDATGSFSHGSTGSRLLSGNSAFAEETENLVADFHQASAALLFNSGYDANLGLLSSVPQKGDTILYDQLSHASIRDGIRLSFAQSFSFAHNDLTDLEKKLSNRTGNVYIVTESVFSMDGDLCPLNELVALATKYNAHLIIDEAHATGVIGEKGAGLVQQLQLQDKIFARVHTFGKACGCHGAAVLGSQQLKSYLLNFARSLIYTTALPEQAVAAIKASYGTFPLMQAEREHLAQLALQFQSAVIAYEKLSSLTPIQAVVVGGNEQTRSLATKLQQAGFDIRPILYPTVPRGKERLRIVLHAFNTPKELSMLVELLQ
jgi:8-amino-7-oxononanoate synthase